MLTAIVEFPSKNRVHATASTAANDLTRVNTADLSIRSIQVTISSVSKSSRFVCEYPGLLTTFRSPSATHATQKSQVISHHITFTHVHSAARCSLSAERVSVGSVEPIVLKRGPEVNSNSSKISSNTCYAHRRRNKHQCHDSNNLMVRACVSDRAPWSQMWRRHIKATITSVHTPLLPKVNFPIFLLGLLLYPGRNI